jgi:hypothetical protein
MVRQIGRVGVQASYQEKAVKAVKLIDQGVSRFAVAERFGIPIRQLSNLLTAGRKAIMKGKTNADEAAQG